MFGRELYRRYLAMYSDCLQVDSWPGYSTEIVRPTIQSWRMQEMNEEEVFDGNDEDDDLDF